jgi:hypothetical protein
MQDFQAPNPPYLFLRTFILSYVCIAVVSFKLLILPAFVFYLYFMSSGTEVLLRYEAPASVSAVRARKFAGRLEGESRRRGYLLPLQVSRSGRCDEP